MNAVNTINAELNLHSNGRIWLAIEGIHPLNTTDKRSLGNYKEEELSNFLNNDAHFKKVSKDTENIQVT